MINRILFVISLIFILTLALGSASADSSADAAATEIYGTTMSPYCPGVTISACTSEDARLLREDILASLNRGLTVVQVKQELTKRFGADVLGFPKDRGFGVVAWLVPPAVVMIGIVLLVWFIRREPQRANATIHQGEGLTAEMRERVENELRQRMG